MGFSLVDDARDEFRDGNREYALRAIGEAKQVFAGIENRLHDLEPDRSSPFGPLVYELRKSIDKAEAECA